MLLTKAQKNNIFNVINTFSLNPAEFEFTIINTSSSQDQKITHNPTGYFAIFSSGGLISTYEVKMSPAPKQHTDNLYHDSWEKVIGALMKWASLLKQEIEEPDLWKTYLNIDTKIKFEPEDNHPFTVTEHELLTNKLNLLEKKIVDEFKLNAEQQSKIKSSIEHQIEMGKSIGKKDWVMFFMGSLQAIAFDLAFDLPKIEKLGSIVKEVFSGLIKIAGG